MESRSGYIRWIHRRWRGPTSSYVTRMYHERREVRGEPPPCTSSRILISPRLEPISSLWYSPISWSSESYHFSPIIVVGLGWVRFTKKTQELLILVFHDCPIFKQTIKPSLYQVSLRYVYYIIRERQGFAYHLIFANFIRVLFFTDYRCWVRFTKNFMKTPIFHEESCFIGYLNFTNNSTNNCPIFK